MSCNMKIFHQQRTNKTKISSSVVLSELPFKNAFKEDDVLAMWCRHLHRNKAENGQETE